MAKNIIDKGNIIVEAESDIAKIDIIRNIVFFLQWRISPNINKNTKKNPIKPPLINTCKIADVGAIMASIGFDSRRYLLYVPPKGLSCSK